MTMQNAVVDMRHVHFLQSRILGIERDCRMTRYNALIFYPWQINAFANHEAGIGSKVG
jgi:hypothetical protein